MDFEDFPVQSAGGGPNELVAAPAWGRQGGCIASGARGQGHDRELEVVTPLLYPVYSGSL